MESLKKIKEDYQYFFENITNYINELKQLVNIKKFNYEPIEIDKIEGFYIKYLKKNKRKGIAEIDYIIAAYFGTAYIWHFGGNWCLDTDKKTETYGQALIENYGGIGYKWIYVSPIDWVYFIKTNQLDDESISQMFIRLITFHKNNPQFIIETNREIQ